MNNQNNYGNTIYNSNNQNNNINYTNNQNNGNQNIQGLPTNITKTMPNTSSMPNVKEKKKGINNLLLVFIIFIIIMGFILFLFPFLAKLSIR